MTDDEESLIEGWLELWEENRERGRELSAPELASPRLDLLPELERRMNALRSLDWLNEANSSSAKRVKVWTVGDEPIAGFPLLELLGRGGFGEVWRSCSPEGLAIAIKIVGWAEKANEERNTLDSLREIVHPCLLGIHRVECRDESLIVVMELAEKSLQDRWRECREKGLPGIPLDELRPYFAQAADGLDALHARGFQHRDIKPSNLLLVGQTLKVADFGLTRILQNSVSNHTGTLSVAFAAPEFFEGQTARSSDQYGLAVSYCQMRGGRIPFEGTPALVIVGHLKRNPDLTMLPPEERPAVLRALHKSPKERWPSCGEFVRAIGKPPLERKWTRRAVLGGLIGTAAGAAATPYLLLPNRKAFWSRQLEQVDGVKVIRQVVCGILGPMSGSDNPIFAFATGTNGSFLWNVQTGKFVRQFPFRAGACAGLVPFWKPKGIAGDDDGAVLEFDLETGQEIKTYRMNDRDINSAVYSPDSLSVWGASSDKNIYRWDAASGVCQQTLSGHTGIVTSLLVEPTNRFALSGGWDSLVILWNAQTGQPLFKMEGHTAAVQSVDMSEDGRLGLSGSWDGTVRLWNLSTGKLTFLLEGHTDKVRSVCFWGKNRAISAGYDQTVRVWDLSKGSQLFFSPPGPSPIESICLVPKSMSTKVPRLVVGTGAAGVWVCELNVGM